MQMNIELMSDHLTKTLNQVRNEILAGLSDTDREAYTHLVDWLRKTDVASGALRVGDTAPDFLYPMRMDDFIRPNTFAVKGRL